MDHFPFKLNLDFGKKKISQQQKLPSLVAKSYFKNMLAKVANFECLVSQAEKPCHFPPIANVGRLSACKQIYYSWVYFLYFTIFHN